MSRQPRQAKITRIYAFIRHSIATVRLAVARVLHTFTASTSLSKTQWQTSTFFALLFQNLVLETRSDIRAISSTAFSIAISQLSLNPEGLQSTVGDSLGEWYQMVMTPPGARLDASLFTRVAKTSTAHDVDKPMMEGDLSLLDTESVMETRLAAAKALAELRKCSVLQVSTLNHR
jgi:TATA-binding protein-associated factor